MGIQPKPDEYATLEHLLREFIAQRPQTITSPRVLAERMAGKAALIKDVLVSTPCARISTRRRRAQRPVSTPSANT
jgi:hypothetical protein